MVDVKHDIATIPPVAATTQVQVQVADVSVGLKDDDRDSDDSIHFHKGLVQVSL